MTRRPNVSTMLALKAAAAVAGQTEDDEPVPVARNDEREPQPGTPSEPVPAAQLEPARVEAEAAPATRGRGRPKGKRPIAARQTIYLDEARHQALARLAEDRGRSVHSLILEGIDHVIDKPKTPGWR